MLNNKADIVENYIRKQLEEQDAGFVELNRSELADKISCAPSQISYVLSTRFTTERGFVVESRRGLGGYIRIALIPKLLPSSMKPTSKLTIIRGRRIWEGLAVLIRAEVAM